MNSDPITPPSRPRSFILRLVVDAHGELRGQISEPGGEDEWRTTFVGFDRLWAMLVARLGQFDQASISQINDNQPGE